MSLPVEAYVVVFEPSATVIVPFAMIPSVTSDVLAVSGTVPVAIAGAATVAAELGVEDEEEEDDDADDDDDEVEDELLDDEVPVVLEPPLMEVSAFCTAAVS